MTFVAKFAAKQAFNKAKTGMFGEEEEEAQQQIMDDTPPPKITPAREKRRFIHRLPLIL